MSLLNPNRILRFGLVVAATLAACRDSKPAEPTAPHGLPTRLNGDVAAASAPTKSILADGKRLDVKDDPNPPSRTRYRVDYHGGPVATRSFNVYVIWYGTWPTSPGDTSINVVTNFLASIGGSPYLNIVQLYSDASGNPATSQVIYGGDVRDDYSRGPTLVEGDIARIIENQVNNFRLPQDPNGLYLVLTSPEVTDTTGLFATYCARHGVTRVDGSELKYVLVGAPSRAPSRCAPQILGPNGTLDGDGIVSHLAAEIANSITDPTLGSWYDRLGLEPADKCVWTYGPAYAAPNGTMANVRIGDHHYLLQQLWLPGKNGGKCAQSW